ncbi:nucleoside triphosphate pyrophosphohydrolase [candidate division KSB1 bacterium]|nr:nucleoside triphosphate pyrophosphohydrolase [candidate division KSB1 bacterium]
MKKLRSDDGCPWDRKQTHQSLRQHLLEEAYEVLETIDEERYDELAGELGDLLLQVVFHAQMASESNRFTINDVLDAITEKLIRRHPHVFGDETVETAEEQIQLWEQTKVKNEGKRSALDGIPKQLPALVRAYRMQGKAAAVGFDWPQIEPVWQKLDEEIKELKHEITESNRELIEEELGDVLFTVVNLSRFVHINPEDALRRTIEKFDRRFKKIEAVLQQQGKTMHTVSLEEMDSIWDSIKAKEKENIEQR